MSRSDPEPEQYDHHEQAARKIFRDSGFEIAAMQYKRTPAQIDALKAFNGVPPEWKHPFAWGYFPNPGMRAFWEKKLVD